MLTWKCAHICMSCKLSGPGGSTLFMYMGSLQIAYLYSFLLQVFSSHSARASSLALPHQSFYKSSQPYSTSPVILQELPALLYLTSRSARAPSSTSPVILQEPSPALPHQSFCSSQLYLTSHSARAPSLALPHQSFCKSSQSCSTSPVILQELLVLLYLTSHSARAPSLALPHQSFCKSSQSCSTSPVILQELPVLLYLASHSARAPSLALPHQSFCKSSQLYLTSHSARAQPCSTSPVILQLPALPH